MKLDGSKARDLRTRMDLTITEFANLLGVTTKSVERWEKGFKVSGTAAHLVRVLGVVLDNTARPDIFKGLLRWCAEEGGAGELFLRWSETYVWAKTVEVK